MLFPTSLLTILHANYYATISAVKWHFTAT